MLQKYMSSLNFIVFFLASELILSPSAGAEIMSARTFISGRF